MQFTEAEIEEFNATWESLRPELNKLIASDKLTRRQRSAIYTRITNTADDLAIRRLILFAHTKLETFNEQMLALVVQAANTGTEFAGEYLPEEEWGMAMHELQGLHRDALITVEVLRLCLEMHAVRASEAGLN